MTRRTRVASAPPAPLAVDASRSVTLCSAHDRKSVDKTVKAGKAAKTAKPLASQTLFRGLDVVSAVAEGCRSVQDISDRTGIAFSTTHRLASALVQIRYLRFEPRKGYRLGSRLVELGFMAYRDSAITTTARPLLEELAAQTQDTVHLAALDEDEGIIYLDKIGGQRPSRSTRASAAASPYAAPAWARR